MRPFSDIGKKMTSRHQNVALKQRRSAMTWILKDINDICVWFESHSNYMVKLFIRILKIIKGIWSLKSFVAILSRFGKCIEVDQHTLWFDLRIYNATLKWMTPLYQQLCYIHSIYHKWCLVTFQSYANISLAKNIVCYGVYLDVRALK